MQAAGGAPVTPAAQTTTPARRLSPVFAAVALAAYAADVITKLIAVDRLSGRGDVEFLGTLLQFHLTRNPGAAFSTGTGFTVGLSLIACAALVVVLVLATRARTTGWSVALGFLLAGIAGNLTDRLLRAPGPLRGHVVDFLMLPHWPIFNVADICINVAAALILIQAFRGVRLDGTRQADKQADKQAEK